MKLNIGSTYAGYGNGQLYCIYLEMGNGWTKEMIHLAASKKKGDARRSAKAKLKKVLALLEAGDV